MSYAPVGEASAYLGAAGSQQFDFRVVERRQAAQEPVLLVAGVVGHDRLRPAQEELDAHGEAGHVDRILAAADPAVVEAGQRAVADDGAAEAVLGDQPDRPHRDLLRVPHLAEDLQVVRVVVVGEVEDARGRVLPDPRQPPVAVGHAARLHRPLLVLVGHRGCECGREIESECAPRRRRGRSNSPTKCSNGTPMRFSCFVSNGVGCAASSITSQKRFGTCFSVYPKRVISANCSGRRNVGVIMYSGGGGDGAPLNCWMKNNPEEIERGRRRMVKTENAIIFILSRLLFMMRFRTY